MTQRTTRARAAAVLAGLAAVVAVGGCGAVTGAEPQPTDGTRTPQVLGAAALDLDVGPLDGAGAIEDCLLPGFAPDPASVEVLYGVEQRTQDGSTPVLVLRNAEGEIGLCDVSGPDRPSSVPLPEATAEDPVAFLANGRAAWDCDGRRLQGYTSTTWLAVSDQVGRVQQRFVVDGSPEPWFTTRARDGLAHLQTWLAGPVPRTAEVVVEHQVLDAAGEPVQQSALPTEPQALETCADGGDAQIG
jgi:hypothetical protein